MSILSQTTWILDKEFLNNAAWRWFAVGGIVLACLIAGKIVSFMFDKYSTRFSRRNMKVIGQFCKSFVGPVTMLSLGVGVYFSGALLFYSHQVDDEWKKELLITNLLWRQICNTIIVLSIGWFVYKLVDILEILLTHWTSRTKSELDDQLVPLVRKTLRIVIIIMVGLFIAQTIFHWNIGAMLAGLGIGGLAFALAAKDMLANLFGSVTIFADRPFQMTERIKVDKYDGIIEEVGFRSTRIRTLDGHLVTIPNSIIANTPVENVSRRPYIKRVMQVTVTYDTPPEKMKLAVDILNEMCESRKQHFNSELGYKVYFTDFNSDNLAITVYYWFMPADWWEYCQFNHDFNIELLSRFNTENIEFAFPTQTLYLKGESPIEVRSL